METRRYILSEYVALRSWWLVPHAYYIKGSNFAHGLKREEFERLLACDGKTPLPDDALTRSLCGRGLIREAAPGDALTEWQKHMDCDNRYMPQMNLQITARCNYNCIHCFNAVDNSPLLSEMPLDDVLKLLDEAQACGVNAFTITGGEPMAHRNFKEIMEAIYARGMFVFDFNTNGFYLRQETLDFFRRIGCRPLMKISFDGIGYHDWMRGRKGAEEDALRAIRLCVENDFPVKVQYNVNRRNSPTVGKSLDLLDGMGVREIRLIRTTPAPRWEQNAAGETLSLGEYFDLSLELAAAYAKTAHTADLTCWQFCTVHPANKSFSVAAVKRTEETFRDSFPLCRGTRGMIAVGANGQVYPCMQMSGWFDGHGIDLGNVKRDGLRATLQSGKYIDCVCQTVRDRCDTNGKCADCRFLPYCMGGCPALAILGSPSGDILAPDPTKCFFFANGYYEKITSALPGYRNLTVMEEREE